jgi:hypothetical protein
MYISDDFLKHDMAHPTPFSVWRVIVMFWLLVCLLVPTEGEFVKFLGVARTLVWFQLQSELHDDPAVFSNLIKALMSQGAGTTKVIFSKAQEGYAELETVVPLCLFFCCWWTLLQLFHYAMILFLFAFPGSRFGHRLTGREVGGFRVFAATPLVDWNIVMQQVWSSFGIV